MDTIDNFENDLHEVKEHTLQKFDQLIEQSRQEFELPGDQKRNKKLLLRCLIKLAGRDQEAIDCEDETIEEEAKETLDNFPSMKNKELVAACYLRLLREPSMKWATLPPWRPKIIDFFDKFYSEDLYREAKIVADSMSHDKVPLLVEIVEKTEEALSATIQGLPSLDFLQTQRQKILTVLNGKVGRVIIRPFMPNNTDTIIGETYNKVVNYYEDREGANVIDSYQEALEAIRKFVSFFSSHCTIYSRLLADILGQKLLGTLQEDFSHNRAAQPAKLEIEARTKKYPFHLIGTTINLGLILKNFGPGFAYDTKITIETDSEFLELLNLEIDFGRFAPSLSQLIKVPAIVKKTNEEIDIFAQVNWRDFDGTLHEEPLLTTLKAQRSDIDWKLLGQTDPYSLEPVISKTELVGRKEILSKLFGSANAANAGSSIIFGQKRVGKTSIAKVLQSQLEDAGFLTIYLEAGDYVMPSATGTINCLGTKLCKKIVENESRAQYLTAPVFDEALSPLTDFLDQFAKIAPDRRIIFILDEFDELPIELYGRGPWGDSFFLTLRSITSRPYIGFILVGGEKIAHILDCQGDQLNKWTTNQVDYFSRETDWSDYKELIQRPVHNFLEYSEDAVSYLYDISAGNPYFTKLLCQFIFRSAISVRDCYITRTEVEQVIDQAVRETGRNTFQHFWEDGIFETSEKASEKSIRRRKILIALSDVINKHFLVSGKTLGEHPLLNDINTLENDLKEFITRKVLDGSINGGFHETTYNFKVRFFYEWLKGRGVQDVIATFADLDNILKEKQYEEQIKVQSLEIVELAKQWGLYRGQTISSENIRAWLDQFAGSREQRAMFRLLQNLKFYKNSYIRKKMEEVHSIVVRGIGRTIELRQQKRSDILVSYLDSVGKSGATLAKLYADEANIYVDNIVEKGKIGEVLIKREDIKVVVFVDDFVGTGNQAIENLGELNSELSKVVRERKIKFSFITLAAFISGWRKVKEFSESLELNVDLHYCELLDETNQCFSERSNIFTDPQQREFAKNVASKYGKIKVKDNPLGYGDLGLAVVFEHGCPNDSLPILWAESVNPKWLPLFKRH